MAPFLAAAWTKHSNHLLALEAPSAGNHNPIVDAEYGPVMKRSAQTMTPQRRTPPQAHPNAPETQIGPFSGPFVGDDPWRIRTFDTLLKRHHIARNIGSQAAARPHHNTLCLLAEHLASRRLSHTQAAATRPFPQTGPYSPEIPLHACS